MNLEAALTRLKDEPIESHAYFLIYCSMPSRQRRRRPLGRLIGKTENQLKHMAELYDWNNRSAVVTTFSRDGEQAAVNMFAELYHNRWNGKYREILKEVTYAKYPQEEMVAKFAREREQNQAIQQGQRLTVEEKQETQLEDMLQSAINKLEADLKHARKTVNVGDIERLIDMRTKIRERKRVEKLMSSAPRETVAQSDRVLRAKNQGLPLLPAFREDLSELQNIVTALEQQDEHPEVFPLRRNG
jgi:hypothetical protein